MTDCRLCSYLAYRDSIERWNEPLFESRNFVVLPSLGALVEGWLLLVPKKHFICIGAIPDSVAIEMQEMKDLLCSVITQSYGQVCAFEHGPNRASCSLGCGVDHAHLHVVPLAFDLYSAVTPLLPFSVAWSEAEVEDCRAAYGRGEDYLYLEQPIGVGRIARHGEFGSQLFRRAIAAKVGIPDQFSWREYPQLARVHATIDRVRAWDGNVVSCQRRPEVAA